MKWLFRTIYVLILSLCILTSVSAVTGNIQYWNYSSSSHLLRPSSDFASSTILFGNLSTSTYSNFEVVGNTTFVGIVTTTQLCFLGGTCQSSWSSSGSNDWGRFINPWGVKSLSTSSTYPVTLDNSLFVKEILSSSSTYGALNVTSSLGLTGVTITGLTSASVSELTNLYWTNDRFDTRLSTTNTLKNITSIGDLSSILIGSSTIGSLGVTSSFAVYNGSATATFAGGLAIETTGLVYDWQTNRVGIGTDSPLYTLDVVSEGPIRFTRLGKSFTFNPNYGGGNLNTDFQTDTGMALTFSPQGDEKMRITTGGNVGIGTTTPGGKLAVNNTGTGLSFIVSDDTDPDATPFVIDASGNVGIGTAAPSDKLHLELTDAQGLRLNRSVNTYMTNINFSTAGTNEAYFGLSRNDGTGMIPGGTANSFVIETASTQDIIFGSNGSIKMIIHGVSGGNVGIGDTSPSYLLTVGSGDKFGVDASGNVMASGTLQVYGNIMVSSTATSTFDNGIRLITGCFAGPDGVCVGGGGITSFIPSDNNNTSLGAFGNAFSNAYVSSTLNTGYLIVNDGAGISEAEISNLYSLNAEHTLFSTNGNVLDVGDASYEINMNTHRTDFFGLLTVGKNAGTYDYGKFSIESSNGNLSTSGTLQTFGQIMASSTVTSTFSNGANLVGSGCWAKNGICLNDVTENLSNKTLSNTTFSGSLDLSLATVTQNIERTFSYPVTTTAWTGTSTRFLGTATTNETWSFATCYTDTGTLNVSFSDGTNLMTMVPVSSTPARFALTTNNTFVRMPSEKRQVAVGTPATSPTTISCTIELTTND